MYPPPPPFPVAAPSQNKAKPEYYQQTKAELKDRMATSQPKHVLFRIPPFLAWATEKDNLAEASRIIKEADSVRHILWEIDRKFLRNDSERSLKIYTVAQEILLSDFESSHIPTKETSNDPKETLSSDTHCILAASSEGVEEDSAPSKRDHCFSEQAIETTALTTDIIELSKELLALFVPLHYSHGVIKKYWGAFNNILVVRYHILCTKRYLR